jgi:hypothetical protein
VSCIRLYVLQILGSQITIINIFVITIARDVKIQGYILFCKIVNSAEQSKQQLLVLVLKKIYVRSSHHPICYVALLLAYSSEGSSTSMESICRFLLLLNSEITCRANAIKICIVVHREEL